MRSANNTIYRDLSVLVLSCDKYSDLWSPFFYCIHKFWKDCPYPMYLGSNTVHFNDGIIKTLLSGPDRDWSSSLLAILKQISTPYVFLWIDDLFPADFIDSEDFIKTINFMKKHKAKHVHVGSQPKPDKVIENGVFGVYESGAPYRAIVFGFWDVEYLKSLLLSGENPWNFEIMGSYRSAYADGFYCSIKNFIPRIHVVEKGKYFRDAYEYCKQHAIPLTTAKRNVLENSSYIKSEVQKMYFNTMIKLPWKVRLRIMNVLRKLFISY
jgi:hypothetical protein